MAVDSDTLHTVIPRHVGVIVDGNRRWAKQHGLPTYEGHLAGYNAVKEVGIEMLARGVEYFSAYIFSTENWKRSADEVKKLMGLVLKLLTSDIPELQKHNVRLKVLGSREGVDKKILKAIDKAEAETAGNTGGVLALCFNYGGQKEITEAVKAIIEAGTPAEAITEELISEHLYAPEVPPIDMVVRTSGEQRLSNFMLWRSAYSEFLFLDKNWPDMNTEDVTHIIEEYTKRGRRFGG
ncbi:di-trans,poly-cis-decaprenylcistransferase [Candidatus Saccharibacteria bacterium TM7i]|nr:di-trans,poly-cis-decaprenylcistransferase [Candidatus Saccharibacteria bacterium TM7i]